MTVTDDQIAELWAQKEAETPRKVYKHYLPLLEAADITITEAQDPHRVYTGIDAFDREMEGVGRGHMLVIIGYSHSGKTLCLLKMLEKNAGKKIAYFCPDETAPLVLTKLTSITSQVPAKALTNRIRQGDEKAIELLKATARDKFPNLAVYDGPLSPKTMEEAYTEVCNEVWHSDADMVIVDYLDNLDAGDSAATRFGFLKSWGKEKKVPLIVIHQTSRTAGSGGQALGIDSGSYGGETYATFMIGVRRKKNALLEAIKQERSKVSPDASKLSEYERDLRWHEYTITLNMPKNKRPGGRTVDEIDFELDTDTGAIYPLNDGEPPSQWVREASLASRDPGPEPVTNDDVTWTEQEMDF